MKQARIAISEAESLVMDVLWRGEPDMPAEAIVTALRREQDWQEATVKSLLNRLLNKGAVRAQKDGRRFLYSPVLQRDAWLSAESSSMLERLFGGRVAPLVAHFGKHRQLSRSDIAELKKLIDEFDDGK